MAHDYAAHDLSDAALGGGLRIDAGRFVDAQGRSVMLRGANVAGSSKLPTGPNGLSHLHEGFYESHRTVSFVGRPFPLAEAPLHFARLQAWGLPLIRLLVTWESIAHAGPQPSDVDLGYIEYLAALIQLMPRYGLKCFVCAHQDVWSRFSGGSGAPGWTFEAAGLDIETFTDTGAAYVHSQDEKRKAAGDQAGGKETSGAFLWPSGYQKLAASTMATLFWAGDSLAPQLQLEQPDGGKVGIQTFLQDAYIDAFGQLADRVAGLEACVGFEPVNEPHRGLINLHDFHRWNYDTDLHIGHYPSLAEALALGSGYKQEVKYYVKSWPWPTRVSHRSVIDPQGRSCWLGPKTAKGSACVWRAHGVWEWNESKGVPVILQYDYFEKDHRPGHDGRRIEWYRDFYAPFIARFSARMQARNKTGLSFVEPIPNEFVPPWVPTALDRQALKEYTRAAQQQKYAVKTVIDTPRPANFVFAPHFYDLNVLFGKLHSYVSVNVQGLSRGMFLPKAVYFGVHGLRANYRTQLARLAGNALASLGKMPIIIGEVGIPFDINHRYAYRTGDYRKQRELMDSLIGAMEDNALAFTLWNYNPDNRVAYGDGWNFEDFSFTNGDDDGAVVQDVANAAHADNPLYAKGRTLDVIIRPYAAKIAGVQVQSHFDPDTLAYTLQWRNEPNVSSNVTEIFVPAYHYEGSKLDIVSSDCAFSFDGVKQSLYVTHQDTRPGAKHVLKIQLQDPAAHKLKQLRARRRSLPSKTDWLFPEALQLWLDELSRRPLSHVLLPVLAAVIALTAAHYFHH